MRAPSIALALVALVTVACRWNWHPVIDGGSATDVLVDAFAADSDASPGAESGTDVLADTPRLDAFDAGTADSAALFPLDDIVQLAAGDQFTCARRSSGSVMCWGNADDARLGAPGQITGAPAQFQVALSDAVQIAAGAAHVCAVRVGGAVWCWGANNFSQLGRNRDGTLRNGVPAAVLGPGAVPLRNIVEVGAGVAFSCARNSDGDVYCWGAGAQQQLGPSDASDVSPSSLARLVQFPAAIAPIVSLAVGGYHSCVLTSAGTVHCWGYSPQGQLGGDQFATVSFRGAQVTQLALGQFHSCARKTDGSVWCWGYNARGQIGPGGYSLDAGLATTVSTPIQVSFGAARAAEIASGWSHVCARLDDGSVWCHGDGRWNQLGSMPMGGQTSFPQRVDLDAGRDAEALRPTQLALGSTHSCLRLSNGQARCWGYDSFGQLGNGRVPYVTTPVRVTPFPATPAAPAMSTLALGAAHTCATTTTGAVHCWGENSAGQLGNNTTIGQGSFGRVALAIPAMRMMEAGGSSTCAWNDPLNVWCWGANGSSQFGVRLDSPTLVPIDPTGAVGEFWGTPIQSVSMNGSGACVVYGSRPRTLRCAGNTAAWIADGLDRQPAAVVDIVPSGMDIAQVALGDNFLCALTTTGTVHCRGSNINGQLGRGDTITTVPYVGVRVVSAASGMALTGVRKIVAGSQHACARSSDDRALCWGSVSSGQSGPIVARMAITTAQEVPLPAGTHVVDIAAGRTSTCALTSDASAPVYCWGDNRQGQLGRRGLTAVNDSPVAVAFPAAVTHATSIYAGASHVCVIADAGSVWCWGDNSSGQLGYDAPVPIRSASPVPVLWRP